MHTSIQAQSVFFFNWQIDLSSITTCTSRSLNFRISDHRCVPTVQNEPPCSSSFTWIWGADKAPDLSVPVPCYCAVSEETEHKWCFHKHALSSPKCFYSPWLRSWRSFCHPHWQWERRRLQCCIPPGSCTIAHWSPASAVHPLSPTRQQREEHPLGPTPRSCLSPPSWGQNPTCRSPGYWRRIDRTPWPCALLSWARAFLWAPAGGAAVSPHCALQWPWLCHSWACPLGCRGALAIRHKQRSKSPGRAGWLGQCWPERSVLPATGSAFVGSPVGTAGPAGHPGKCTWVPACCPRWHTCLLQRPVLRGGRFPSGSIEEALHCCWCYLDLDFDHWTRSLPLYAPCDGPDCPLGEGSYHCWGYHCCSVRHILLPEIHHSGQ